MMIVVGDFTSWKMIGSDAWMICFNPLLTHCKIDVALANDIIHTLRWIRDKGQRNAWELLLQLLPDHRVELEEFEQEVLRLELLGVEVDDESW